MSRNHHQTMHTYISTCIFLVVTIGFVPDIYSVIEGTDQFANLTVQLISGELGHEVIVNLNTLSGSAISTVLYALIN